MAAVQVTGLELTGCMKRYRATFEDNRTQFMVQAHAWLDGAGFMVFLKGERRGAPIKLALGGVRGEALTVKGSGLDTYVMPEYQPPVAVGL
jgi:hypothetical protein